MAAAAISSDRVVFFAREGSLQAAPVQRDVEPGLDRSKALRRRELGVRGLEIENEGDHLVRYLVATFGAPETWHKSDQTVCRKRALCLVESRPGEAKGGGDIADRHAVDTVASHHLVTDLHQILGVEERIAAEQRVANGFGVWVERTVARQGLAFRVLLGHISLQWFVNINTPYIVDCQPSCSNVVSR